MESQLLAESLARDPRFEIVAVANAADVHSIVTIRQPRQFETPFLPQNQDPR